MNAVVYIPTKNRVEYLVRSLRSWIEYDVPVVVVSESQHRSVIKEAYSSSEFSWDGVEVLWLRSRDKGIGFARNRIVEDADKRGLASFMMADDDQIISGDVYGMLKFATRRDVTAIGMYKSIYRLFLGDNEMNRAAKKKLPKAYLNLSLGYPTIALNRRNIMKIGGFNESLNQYEDHEIRRMSIATLRIPWFIYTAAFSNSMQPDRVTHFSGGISTLPEPREVLIKRSHEIVYKRWPDYITDPSTGKKYRCNWRKMLEDFIPGLSYPVDNISAGERPFEWRPK